MLNILISLFKMFAAQSAIAVKVGSEYAWALEMFPTFLKITCPPLL